MTILMLDPVADQAVADAKKERGLDSLIGKRVGYIFNQHVTALDFWTKLESEIEARLQPSAVHRLYKVNTWAPAPRAEIDNMLGQVDYVLVGVGA